MDSTFFLIKFVEMCDNLSQSPLLFHSLLWFSFVTCVYFSYKAILQT